METMIEQVGKYLLEVLGITLEPRPWDKSGDLPHYLRERYRFFHVQLLGMECVLAVDGETEAQTPAVIGKQLEQIRLRHPVEPIYVQRAVTSYNRKRLIGQRIPFIIPGNQMYLPPLGIDLREHLRKVREKRPLFSPSTQVLLLYVLWRKETGTLTPAAVAGRLGYSAMTMTRGFDELATAGIGAHSVQGKERHLRFAEAGQGLWDQVRPYLGTPVKRRWHVATPPPAGTGTLAGESALAAYTMLGEPPNQVWALSAEEWKRWAGSEKIIELPQAEPGSWEIELWKYAPTPFALGGKVDRLSLYLSLKDNTDERVQSALDSLLGGMEW